MTPFWISDRKVARVTNRFMICLLSKAGVVRYQPVFELILSSFNPHGGGGVVVVVVVVISCSLA